MKKLYLTLILIITILSGCESRNVDHKYLQKLDQPTEITFWYVDNLNLSGYVEEITQNFNDENEMITVNAIPKDSFYQLSNDLIDVSDEDMPNVIQTDMSTLPYLYDNDLLIDLSPYFNDPGLAISNNDYYSEFINLFSTKDGYYGVPLIAQTDVIFLNNNYVTSDQIPTSMDTLYQLAYEIYRNKGVSGLSYASLKEYFTFSTANCGFISWLDYEGQIVLGDDCIYDALKKYDNAIDLGYTTFGDVNYEIEAFLNGNLAMIILPSSYYNYIDNYETSFDVDVVRLPNRFTPLNVSGLSIVNGSDSTKSFAALTFIDYLTLGDGFLELQSLGGIYPLSNSFYEVDHTFENNIDDVLYQQIDLLESTIPKFPEVYDIYNIYIEELIESIFVEDNDIKSTFNEFTFQAEATRKDN